MSVKINYKNGGLKKPLNNLVLFANEKFNINLLKKYISNLEFSYINNLIDVSGQKKNLLVFELNAKKNSLSIDKKKYKNF